MAYVIGAFVGLGVVLLAYLIGFDRDRAFYPAVLIVIASYYILFAAMGGPTSAIWIEAAATSLFAALAIVGFRKNLWFVVIGLLAHGTFDFIHPALIDNSGVPSWWPPFCLSADLLIGVGLAMYLAGFRRPLGEKSNRLSSS